MQRVTPPERDGYPYNRGCLRQKEPQQAEQPGLALGGSRARTKVPRPRRVFPAVLDVWRGSGRSGLMREAPGLAQTDTPPQGTSHSARSRARRPPARGRDGSNEARSVLIVQGSWHLPLSERCSVYSRHWWLRATTLRPSKLGPSGASVAPCVAHKRRLGPSVEWRGW
jgi:transposase